MAGNKRQNHLSDFIWSNGLLSLPSPQPDLSHEAIRRCGCPASQRGMSVSSFWCHMVLFWPVPVYNQQYIQYSKFSGMPPWMSDFCLFAGVCICVCVFQKPALRTGGQQITCRPEKRNALGQLPAAALTHTLTESSCHWDVWFSVLTVIKKKKNK